MEESKGESAKNVNFVGKIRKMLCGKKCIILPPLWWQPTSWIPDSNAGDCLRKIKESFREGKTEPRNMHTSEFRDALRQGSYIWNQNIKMAEALSLSDFIEFNAHCIHLNTIIIIIFTNCSVKDSFRSFGQTIICGPLWIWSVTEFKKLIGVAVSIRCEWYTIYWEFCISGAWYFHNLKSCNRK